MQCWPISPIKHQSPPTTNMADKHLQLQSEITEERQRTAKYKKCDKQQNIINDFKEKLEKTYDFVFDINGENQPTHFTHSKNCWKCIWQGRIKKMGC